MKNIYILLVYFSVAAYLCYRRVVKTSDSKRKYLYFSVHVQRHMTVLEVFLFFML